MSPLRLQMIAAMQQRGFSPRTHESYLQVIIDLTRTTRCPPEQLSVTQLQDYLDHLVQQRGLSASSVRLALNAMRFFYLQVLHRLDYDVRFVVPKRPQKIPELLTRAEVGALLAASATHKAWLMLSLCYSCGLRVSELVSLYHRNLDFERQQLRIEQGKGAKDRLVPFPPSLIGPFNDYLQRARPVDWLFPGMHTLKGHLNITTAQKHFTKAKRSCGIKKVGGIHSLRHAYATHQLEQGVPIQQLQRQMGHRSIQSTLRYIHWLPGSENERHPDLLQALVQNDE